MIPTLALTAALTIAPAPPVDRDLAGITIEHRDDRPTRGGAGRFADSNVAAVWDGATMRERLIWRCIRAHESMHSGHYTAENPTSTASGAGQWIDATWVGVAKWVRVNGRYVARQYRHASDAPAWVQDATYRHVYAHHGLAMWRGTHCAPELGAN